MEGNDYENDIKGVNKVVKIYVGRYTTVHNPLFFLSSYTMNELSDRDVFISQFLFSVVKKTTVFCVVKVKKENKSIQQQTFETRKADQTMPFVTCRPYGHRKRS